ncbi:MAG: hypothetical protein ACLFWD_06295, partial [Anaerolineales bacterium]
HGPAAYFEWEAPSDTGLKERFSILNAIYLPDDEPWIWGENLSSVNTFRLVFNEVFNASYQRLPDVAYHSPSEFPFDLTTVPRFKLLP